MIPDHKKKKMNILPAECAECEKMRLNSKMQIIFQKKIIIQIIPILCFFHSFLLTYFRNLRQILWKYIKEKKVREKGTLLKYILFGIEIVAGNIIKI